MSNHWILFYDYVPDYMDRRAPLRPAHIAVAQAAVDAGTLVLAGAYADPPDGAALVFRAEDVATVESFVAADPYVQEGLVTSWRIRAWTAVAGTALAPPAHDAAHAEPGDEAT
jgi:hypothetical protein